jgi:diamine N-acetyltransferase
VMEMHIQQTRNPKILANLIQGTHQVFHEKYPHYFKPFNFDAAEQYFTPLVEQEQNEFHVLYDLYDGNEMVGFIWSYIDKQEESPLTEQTMTLYIKKVVVHPNHRNRGYGQQLVEYMETLAKEKRCQFVEVELWYLDDDVVQFLQKSDYTLIKGNVWKAIS